MWDGLLGTSPPLLPPLPFVLLVLPPTMMQFCLWNWLVGKKAKDAAIEEQLLWPFPTVLEDTLPLRFHTLFICYVFCLVHCAIFAEEVN